MRRLTKMWGDGILQQDDKNVDQNKNSSYMNHNNNDDNYENNIKDDGNIKNNVSVLIIIKKNYKNKSIKISKFSFYLKKS